MKEFHIKPNDAGQRLNKFLEKAVPRLSAGMMHKACRIKRIKRNGKRVTPADRLACGDVLQLYLNDDLFSDVPEEEAFRTIQTPRINILYEDEHILLVDKAPGMVVHADDHGTTDTLIAHIQAHLYQSGAWNPADAYSFAPALCNRIDRGTGGIVIAAKTAEALRILNEKIKNRELQKKYLCIVHGAPQPAAGQITLFLRRDEKRGQVTAHRQRVPGAKTAVTRYRTLAVRDGLALLECTLVTGRTHQIRAHLSAISHPLLGDGKYGREAQNQPYGERSQALYSYQLRFAFQTDGGVLHYLNERSFQVHTVPFVSKYFPEYRL